MIYIGIDPGEHWTGIAVLQQKKERKWLAEMATLDVAQNPYRLAELIFDELDFTSDAVIVCEDYRVRPEGYNRFTAAHTARAIGAIEFSARLNNLEFHLVPPADPDEQLSLLGLSEILERWRKDWPTPRAATWHHARSAWRVLGHHLLVADPGFLRSIGAALYAPAGCTNPAPLLHGTAHGGVKTPSTVTTTSGGLGDLVAPRATWWLGGRK